MKITRSSLILAVILGLFSPYIARADVKLPAIFGDHMVLQQEMKLPVWGWATPGEQVTVTFGASKAAATAYADGKWRADLPPVPAGTPPGTLVVAGKNTITINDVLIGEVWVCSGQSNMEFHLGSCSNAAKESPQPDNQFRLFHVVNRYALEPFDDVQGSWQVRSYDSPDARNFLNNFSGVAYYFGKNLRAALKRPVGLIESAQGGSTAQDWMGLSAFQANPDPIFQRDYTEYKTMAASCPGGEAEFDAKNAVVDAATQKWADSIRTDKTYQAAVAAWNVANAKARAAGQPAPPPVPLPAQRPNLRSLRGNTPTFLFNGMLNGLIPFAIRGATWYQGEGNTAHGLNSAFDYRTVLPALIADWRTRWGQGDFPFLIVQLGNTGPWTKNAAENSLWAVLRESQLKTLSVPNTGMTVSFDLDPSGEVHFTDKEDVGARLALAARHVAYGENLVYTGPIYDSCATEGNKIRIAFKPDSVGGGLIIGSSPWTDPRTPPISKTELLGFAIAGADKNWVWAEAKIDGNTVVVSSAQVASPVAIRYAWADNPIGNLYNKEGLPASPFRTDDWLVTPPPVTRASPAPAAPAAPASR